MNNIIVIGHLEGFKEKGEPSFRYRGINGIWEERVENVGSAKIASFIIDKNKDVAEKIAQSVIITAKGEYDVDINAIARIPNLDLGSTDPKPIKELSIQVMLGLKK